MFGALDVQWALGQMVGDPQAEVRRALGQTVGALPAQVRTLYKVWLLLCVVVSGFVLAVICACVCCCWRLFLNCVWLVSCCFCYVDLRCWLLVL
jgi:hypothetical protein